MFFVSICYMNHHSWLKTLFKLINNAETTNQFILTKSLKSNKIYEHDTIW